MQMTRFRNKLSRILCMVFIAAITLTTTACGNNTTNNPDTETESQLEQDTSKTDDSILGEGETEFFFTVTDGEGNETKFTIHTDKTIVGEALLELNLITGEDGDYGLYVKTVNGITADYDVDQTYWAFYIDGEYAMTGVDVTDITAGSTYSFKVEK